MPDHSKLHPHLQQQHILHSPQTRREDLRQMKYSTEQRTTATFWRQPGTTAHGKGQDGTG